jgi:hypothetical protein
MVRDILKTALVKQCEHLAFCMEHEREMLPLAVGIMRELLSHPQATGPEFECFRRSLDKLTHGMTAPSPEVLEHWIAVRWTQARRALTEETLH